MVYNFIKEPKRMNQSLNNAKLILLPNPTLPYTFFEYHICLQRRAMQ
jgi:hypothetical protein